jgi:NADH:ubiquinone oxidoreductase subunit C
MTDDQIAFTKKQEIFEQTEDYYDWDKQLEFVQYYDEASRLLKARSKKAFKILKEHFGIDYHKSVEFTEGNRTLSHSLINEANWSREWLCWFAESIKKLKNEMNFKTLIDRLKNPKKFSEGLSVLEAARKLFDVGFRIDFDPTISYNGKIKVPDMRVSCAETEEEFYVEVSTLDQSAALIRNSSLTMDLFRIAPGIHYSGCLFKSPSEKTFNELKKEVETKATKVFKEGGTQIVSRSGLIEMAISHPNDAEYFQSWVELKKYRKGVFYLPQENFNHAVRLKQKIQTKQKQLPSDKPNVLFVKLNKMMSFNFDKISFINEVEDGLHGYNHLLGVVAYDFHLANPSRDIVIKDMNTFVSRYNDENEFSVENTYAFFNKYSHVKLSAYLLTRLFKAMINGDYIQSGTPT